MSKEKQIEEITKILLKDCEGACTDCEYYERYDGSVCIPMRLANALYNAGYRKQSDEELIDKIATYFEKEDNWTKLKCTWNICGKSVQLRDMLRDAICCAKMKGGAE